MKRAHVGAISTKRTSPDQRSRIGTLWNVPRSEAVSLRLDARELDHLAPLLGLVAR